ncbi:MAG: hypothetical protein QM504_10840, partial [Pseudomonadota bacterium]
TYKLTLYRIFFISMFLLLGLTGVGMFFFELFVKTSVFFTEPEVVQQALHITALVIGAAELVSGGLMFYLLQEKRNTNVDRRQHSIVYAFPERRTVSNRRRL